MTRSATQLRKEFADTNWRLKFIDLCSLMELLRDCIIPDDYVVPDEFNGTIKLSAAGHNVLDRLTRKDKVNPKDARLMCALTLGHSELFVDIDALEIEKLSAVIHSELKEGSIQFPFIWGRDLYDAYAELFEEEKDTLTNDETLRLLNKLPPGVFQYGSFTVGPYGLRRSLSTRNILGRRSVAAYHCSVPSCKQIHPVMLRTGDNASINRDRDKLSSYLQGLAGESCDWWEFAADISGSLDAQYGDQRAGVLLPLLGDTLSDAEMRRLVCELLDGTKGSLRRMVVPIGLTGDAEAATASLGRAEMLQICLIADEDSIASAVDNLIHTGEIAVPRGDVRRPVINRGTRSGAFRLRTELGQYGVRFVSDDPGLAILRERRLLGKLYLRDPGADIAELEWQLRGIQIEDLDERLEHFFRTKDPRDALMRLVLARKTNMIAASHEVNVDSDWEMTDNQLVDTLLWKLGFPVHDNEDPHAAFWSRLERLSALTQSSAIGSSDRFLETAAPFFSELEGLLLDSLAFTTWALLVDHTSSDTPFAYDDDEDRTAGLALLQAAVKGPDDQHRPNYANERVELRNLAEGFATLARRLEETLEESHKYDRPIAEIPLYDGKTDLKRFLFRSTVPFLDLSRPSQERILDGLRKIKDVLVAAEVHAVRNDYAHYRRVPPDISRMEVALEAIRQCVTRIENLGFCRLVYEPRSVETDRWGQSLHEYGGPRSYEHTFTRPTTLDWMGLPDLDEPQYLLRAASFGDPNEVLRFTRRYHSEFTKMWQGFPKRRQSGSGAPAPEEQASGETDVEIASS